MNELAPYQGGLPDTIDDLAHFLLIAPEKATAMRAEIRAIKKVGLAKAVYDQKLEEQRRLCDMILDASVRLGEMTKAIPSVSGRRTDLKPVDSAVVRSRTKTETVRDLGFSTKQVERFETLADNKDLVELEKVKARAEGRMPTRTNVIDMAQARKKMYQQDMERIDTDGNYAKAFTHAVHAPLTIADDLDDVAAAVWRNANGDVSEDIRDIDNAIQALSIIKAKLMKGGSLYGSFKTHH